MKITVYKDTAVLDKTEDYSNVEEVIQEIWKHKANKVNWPLLENLIREIGRKENLPDSVKLALISESLAAITGRMGF